MDRPLAQCMNHIDLERFSNLGLSEKQCIVYTTENIRAWGVRACYNETRPKENDLRSDKVSSLGFKDDT